MKTEPNDSVTPQTKTVTTRLPYQPAPTTEKVTTSGLTKREYFAAMAMQGLMANPNVVVQRDEKDEKSFIMACTKAADALIKQLNK